jgi:hypothetical protein
MALTSNTKEDKAMKRIQAKVKTLSMLALAGLASATFYTHVVHADDAMGDIYLMHIDNSTSSALQIIETLPAYLTQIVLMATSFLTPDNGTNGTIDWSTNWANQQNYFATINADALNNQGAVLGTQKQLVTTLFGTTVPVNVNDLDYASLLGSANFFQTETRPNVDPALNYVTNSSGLGLALTPPGAGWGGSATDQQNYTNFYNAVSAVQTYDAYALSQNYQDSKTITADSTARLALIQQSSNSSWFASVMTNDLGWVLRQLLVYTSQNYVLLDQLVQSQRQMATTLAMTNTLFIANSGFQASLLLQKAKSASH